MSLQVVSIGCDSVVSSVLVLVEVAYVCYCCCVKFLVGCLAAAPVTLVGSSTNVVGRAGVMTDENYVFCWFRDRQFAMALCRFKATMGEPFLMRK
jgi:hypothetical protein